MPNHLLLWRTMIVGVVVDYKKARDGQTKMWHQFRNHWELNYTMLIGVHHLVGVRVGYSNQQLDFKWYGSESIAMAQVCTLVGLLLNMCPKITLHHIFLFRYLNFLITTTNTNIVTTLTNLGCFKIILSLCAIVIRQFQPIKSYVAYN